MDLLKLEPSTRELPSPDSQLVKDFMSKISNELDTTLPTPSQVLSLGSTIPTLIPKMNRLVLAGVKRAMAGFPAPIDPTSGDLIIAVNPSYEPEILLRVISRTSPFFQDVTDKFVFEEGHPEFGRDYWLDWHQKFWEKKLDNDGTAFGDGKGRRVLNMIFEVVYPVPEPLSVGSDPVKALLELVERKEGLKVGIEMIKEVFEFGEGNRGVNKKGNSMAVRGSKTARMSFPVLKGGKKAGDYAVGLGIFGEPYLLIRTTWTEERQFDQIPEEFAKQEGFYQEWIAGKMGLWSFKKDQDGVEFGEGIGKKVLLERFETVWPKIEEEFP